MRLSVTLLMAALAVSVIVTVYLWVRALGSVAPVTPRPPALLPAERRIVPVLPVAAHERKKPRRPSR
jgi:hypothetical protein